MPDAPRKRLPAQQSIQTKALVETLPEEKAVGRPRKVELPPLPRMPMTDAEQALFDFWLYSFKKQYPDLVDTDHLLLYLAGLEFIKYLRVIAEELETGTVISMARQHPGVNMRALLDQLSVTRKARTSGRKDDDDDATKEAREKFGKLFGF